jgi:photosystem II stability/assembly factor-like uncharacterized protein
VFKSTNGGGSWNAAANTGLTVRRGFTVLAIEATTPTTLYAGQTGDGVFESTDGGNTWSAANTGLPDHTSVSALAIDPLTPSTLYAGGTIPFAADVFKSTDAGATWSATGLLNGGVYAGRVHALAIDPITCRTLYVGTDSGVFKSTHAGATWNALNAGLTNTHVVALAIDPTTPDTLYAGTGGGGVFSIQQVALCTGDCNASGSVTVDELITLVNIALGNAQPAACVNGVPGGAAVDIALIIQAVNSALNGCGA